MTGHTPRRSSLAMALLALLAESPMHPYRMQQLIRQRRKDKIVNVDRRPAIYQTIERLLRDGLIQVRDVERDEGRPERTVYEVTDAGRQVLLGWLREMLAVPAPEFPEFPAALGFLPLLEPADAQALLQQRAEALQRLLDADADEAQAAPPGLPRLFTIEDDYRGVLLRAELHWVHGLIDELASRSLHWDAHWLREVSQRLEG